MATTDNLRVSPLQFALLEDAGGTGYVSPGPADDNGLVAMVVPAGTYTVYQSPTGAPPWTAVPGLSAFVVGTGSDPAGDLTPTGAVFPGNGTGAQTVCGHLSGNGAPSNSVGSDGWFYYRGDGTVGSNIYKKSGGAWSAIL